MVRKTPSPKPWSVSAWSRNSPIFSTTVSSEYGRIWTNTSSVRCGYWWKTRAPMKENAVSSGISETTVTKARADAKRSTESSCAWCSVSAK